MKNTIRDIKKDIEKYKMMLEKKESYLKQTGIPTKNVLTADEINNIGDKFDGLIDYLADLYDDFPRPEEREKIVKEVEEAFSDEFKSTLEGLRKYDERLSYAETQISILFGTEYRKTFNILLKPDRIWEDIIKDKNFYKFKSSIDGKTEIDGIPEYYEDITFNNEKLGNSGYFLYGQNKETNIVEIIVSIIDNKEITANIKEIFAGTSISKIEKNIWYYIGFIPGGKNGAQIDEKIGYIGVVKNGV